MNNSSNGSSSNGIASPPASEHAQTSGSIEYNCYLDFENVKKKYEIQCHCALILKLSPFFAFFNAETLCLIFVYVSTVEICAWKGKFYLTDFG